jgi:hypothetical protein
MSRKRGRQRNRRKRSRKRNLARSQTVTAQVAKSQVIRNQNPLKQLRLRHVEFVMDVVGDGTSYKTDSIVINPGLSSVFPWLSRVAGAFESYVFNALTFMYVPSCATSNGGSVGLAPDYDPEDLDVNFPPGKAVLSGFQDAVRTPVWENAKMVCTPRNLKKRMTYFVRENQSETSGDRLFDCGRLHWWFSNVDADVGGEIWVSYDITLFTPQRHSEYHPDEAMGKLAGTNEINATYPFKNTDDELMPLKANDSTISLDPGGDTVILSEPNKLYALTSIITGNGSTFGTQSDWGSAVNGTLSYLKTAVDSTSQEGTWYGQFLTDNDVSIDNPATVTHPGVNIVGGTSEADESLLSVVQLATNMAWASF